MGSKISVKCAFLITFIFLIGFFLLPVLLPDEHRLPQKQDRPFSLSIPTIGVSATLEDVGLTTQGALGVPKEPADAAWYDLGPIPGEQGDAIIDGHYGWMDNIPAVFDDLSQLKPGDQIYVQDQDGTILTFVVRALKLYDKNDDASEIFNSDDGKAHLNLITCEGVWDAAENSYSNRLIVFSDKE